MYPKGYTGYNEKLEASNIGYNGLSNSIMLYHTQDTDIIVTVINAIMKEIISISKSGEIPPETEKKCYMLHWLFCNATPFIRGSAGLCNSI